MPYIPNTPDPVIVSDNDKLIKYAFVFGKQIKGQKNTFQLS